MTYSLTQTQVIQSLAEALSWFERELSWGVKPAELNHLTGRIGELYAAMITSGQMALETNQRGYDVISSDNERISVKTITTSNHIRFNSSTFDLVDRVIILKINIDDDTGVSVETLLDTTAQKARRKIGSNLTFNVINSRPKKPLKNLTVSSKSKFGIYVIHRYENGSIEVLLHGKTQPVAKPHLREIAAQLEIDVLNSEGKTKNTRQLGEHIIKKLTALNTNEWA